MDWLNLLALLWLIAGNTTLWVAYVNRTHALPLTCGTLHRLRRVHDVMIILVPLLLIVGLGLTGPKLLLGGSWAKLTPFWWAFVGVCLLGGMQLVFVTIRNILQRAPEQLIDKQSETIDIADKLGAKPVEPGKYYRLAMLPMNEQFEVEFNQKTFQLESLPAELDGLSILHISDWHFMGTLSQSYFKQVSDLLAQEPVDIVCFTGDLIDSMKCVEWIPETLGKLKGKYGNFFILGNHDWYQDPDVIREAVSKIGWVNVASETVELEIDHAILQIGGDETPWMGTSPEFSEIAHFRLLLCHTPDNLQSARDSHVDLMLSGHNHGGQVQLPLVGPVYSPSRFGTQYASGIFWEAPTLLHISRGLSGRHPLRYHCRPEVTRIVLKAVEVSPEKPHEPGVD
ncbi:metallophosphoesterase [Thalassoglobus polymorphus]|uniref:Putative metallophosphoesterase n=1 Tax=Thalassoglobus polymorphus TaxID=2527994 RepID=A0A517QTX8_9PLAN|nr:metallophosphoesterase [Thalassoglobus polymorphus]QDT35099.1 putative metallophosphoesterase [Thalassoglobus polymorphus]